jgi:hypothetical protein
MVRPTMTIIKCLNFHWYKEPAIFFIIIIIIIDITICLSSLVCVVVVVVIVVNNNNNNNNNNSGYNWSSSFGNLGCISMTTVCRATSEYEKKLGFTIRHFNLWFLYQNSTPIWLFLINNLYIHEVWNFCKSLGFNGGGCGECRLLGCDAMCLLLEPTFRRNVSPPSSWWN